VTAKSFTPRSTPTSRPAKKFWWAVCWWRSVCCDGTLDTSDRNANSAVFFHAVSAASVCLYEVVFALGVVGAVPFSQGFVPHQAHTPEGAVQHRCLVGVRVGPAPVRHPHNIKFAGGDVLSKQRVGRGTAGRLSPDLTRFLPTDESGGFCATELQ
jgi:hypothetical protein